MALTDTVTTIVTPLLDELGVELVDVEHRGAILRVVVDEPGGISLDRLGAVTLTVSRALDDADPIAGRYTLEVSSPGVERPLRTPRHFAAVVGQKVTFRWTHAPKTERVTGVLLAADDEAITLRAEPQKPTEEPQTVEIAYREIDKARTVFEWGPGPKPGKGSKPGAVKASRAKSAAAGAAASSAVAAGVQAPASSEMTMVGDQ